MTILDEIATWLAQEDALFQCEDHEVYAKEFDVMSQLKDLIKVDTPIDL